MKQYITFEQLKELSEANQKKLKYWLIDRHCRPTFIEQEGCLRPAPRDIYYLPNIGQMIEFLHEHNKMYCIEVTSKNTWEINDNFKIEYNELSDGLWEAVKEILENE